MAETDSSKGPENKPETVSSNKRRAAPVFTKKENATLDQRIEILNWYHANGENQSKTAKHFDPIYPNLKVKQPLVSAWVKDEAKWREEWARTSGRTHTAKRICQTQHPDISEMLDLWVTKAMADDLLITGEVLRQKWTKFADLAGVPEDERLNLSEGWLARFKSRNGLKQFKRHGEGGSVDPERVERERRRVQGLIEEYGYDLRDIFNMDETGLFYGYVSFSFDSIAVTHFKNRMPPDRGLADKRNPGIKGSKVRLTYALTSNATGSEKLPPIVIGKAYKPRAFGNKTGTQLGFHYRNNAKAWMTSSLYQEWLRQWDRKLCAENRKILLLQDNFSGHIIPNGLQSIHVENFEPNLTAHVQPMDQGIIRCFKAYYRAKFIQRAVDRYDTNITPSEIYDINQLQGMRLADAAWHEVDATTIKHCWHKAGILPDTGTDAFTLAQPPAIPISSLLNTNNTCDQGDPIANAEQHVESALDELESTGALQHANRMDINALLNPADESRLLDDTSDQEIYEAVQDSRKGADPAEALIDSDIESDVPVNTCPTRRELLQAASVINSYVNTLDSTFARQMEAVLASFGRQMRLEESRSMTSTHINDYFTRK